MARSAAEHAPQYHRAQSAVPPGAAVNIIVLPGRCFFAGIRGGRLTFNASDVADCLFYVYLCPSFKILGTNR